MRRADLDVGDTALLAKLATGEMIAIETKYHQNCLQQSQAGGTERQYSGQESCLHGIAFAELVTFLEDTNNNEDNAPVFKLIDIALLYKVRLEQLGLTLDKRIHTTNIAFGIFWSESTFAVEGNTSEFWEGLWASPYACWLVVCHALNASSTWCGAQRVIWLKFLLRWIVPCKLPAGCCTTTPLGSCQHDTRFQSKHQASHSSGQ